MRRHKYVCGYGEENKSTHSDASTEPLGAPTDLGSWLDEILKIAESVPAEEWERFPADFSKNVDHYLYGTKRNDEEGSG
jgi:hypothetical protein